MLDTVGLFHCRCSQSCHVKCTDQVDVDGALEHIQGMRTVLAHRLDCRCDTGAIDQTTQGAHANGRIDGSLAIQFRGHVTFDETATKLFGQCDPCVDLYISEHYFAAVGSDHAGSGGTEARCAAGDQEYIVFDLHTVLAGLKNEGFPSS
ncbi:hypothetical protein IMCC9480_1614 [Oxalobacteraceae bacterium IMCC9480]|nr:hypothetical protein IMCC9480_1614 [Oxalobacteraceae bacterium IMCC9480]